LIDLTVAIQVGVVLAAFLFLQRMSDVTEVNIVTQNLGEEEEDTGNGRSLANRDVPPGVEVFEIYGSLFFGAIERFKDSLRRIEKRPRVLIIRMRRVPTVDATGLQVLEDVLTRTQREDGTLLLTGVADQPLRAMEQSGFLTKLGRENVLENIDVALERARMLLKPASV
jgi:SulP family sulfate permease